MNPLPDPEPQRNDVAAVSALDEPNRRRLYDYVSSHSGAATRDEASDALQIPRQTAAFHLDKLVEVGLLDVEFERRTGRTGPGAGRPAKLYQRAERDIHVNLPERSYELAGRLLAQAIDETESTGESPRAVLARLATQLGHQLGAQTGGSDDQLQHTLERWGYEPRVEADDIALVNCPFHQLARTHTQLVCGMNLHLVKGLVTATECPQRRARLDPREGYCCVRIGTTTD
ncbi:helix-turn-helix domain-containing protein [Gordonia sp. HY002]|uniref:helix-turn-helix transcriptional regulator n=1 Tax=Gordonia zhenghanii TaxID=2911516 RepID=UPI001EF06E5E|nr:helix-turn-helix domain-containing protein [Gordonia zhenghanii]MCF8571995.1 helix-turn-helix domain-containing protein [Gordonia zhenghanii]MCF8606626.1 helix-turn-helix domain-containing protein [Gordonia zhenghanii]